MYFSTKCKSTARKRARRPKLRNRILSSLLTVSLLCGNFVILPSVAAEEVAYCGLEEHTHSDECYKDTQTLVCEIEENHVHSDECRKIESTLICGITEQVHDHTGACYATTQTLTCTEHAHSAECWEAASTLICENTSEEHAHTDECYTETETLICDYPDSTHEHGTECYQSKTELTCELHQHSESCYEDTEVLTCGVAEENHQHSESCLKSESTLDCDLEEHKHTVACYSDSTADTETAAEWEATLPDELSGNWAEDLLAIAKSQLGYKESTRNYLVAEDGTLMGYSRYGAWYDAYENQAYLDWNIPFLFFSLSYSNVRDFPLEETCPDWIESLEYYELYREVGKTYPVSEEDTEGEAYTPTPGDMVFVDTDEDGKADRVGVFSESKENPKQLIVIEGDVDGAVAEVTYDLSEDTDAAAASEDTDPEPRIVGYADMTQAQADAQPSGDATILGTSTPTVYFAAPIEWTNAGYTIKVYVRCGSEGEGYNKTFVLAMTDTGTKDSAGRKIYSYTFTASECPYGGFYELYFQAFDSSGKWVCQYKAIDSSWMDSDNINRKQWTPNSTVSAANSSTDGSWGDYAPAEEPDVNEVTGLPPVASGKRRVFYDATLSKLSYEKDGVVSYEIPARGTNVIYCWADQRYVMTKLASYTSGGHTYTDVYYVDIPSNCTTVTFASFALTNATNYGWSGESTKNQTIPSNLTNPCFYADSSDKVIYDSNPSNQRSGYWAEAFTVRDAEAGKNSDVVNITTETFDEDEDALYVTSTFYDYYTDYELNGYNRDTYGNSNGASFRNWVTFRQFNQALSDYYEESEVPYPLYEGHFQPSIYGDAYQFDYIAGTLGLYGYDGSTDYEFFSSNNSALNAWGTQEWSDEKLYNYAAQGLVNNTLLGGNVTAAGSSSILPFFNSDFLLGNNSKNTVLGDVYQGVSFPFKKQDIDNNGVEYWVFDSAKTTLEMKQSGGKYYLEDVGNQSWAMNVNSSGTTTGDAVSNTYGFFPFNKGSTGNSGSTYNYGFGCRLDIDFRLTEDRKVLDKNGNPVDITFQFSGDDDVWVFIDDLLVLDVGGEHGKVDGTINFADKVSTVSRVKTSAANKGIVTPEETNGGQNYETAFPSALQSADALKGEHTLTMFYMERGMWESNMKITFNFPDENILEVEKEVDDGYVNDDLFKGLFTGKDLFTFNIKTLATHFGSKEASAGSDNQKSVVSLNEKDGTDITLSPCSSNITFRNGNDNKATDGADIEQIYWKSDQDDGGGAKRDERYGEIKLNKPFPLSGYQYLDFQIYYNWSDTPSLSNLFIDLVDASGNTLLTDDYLSSSKAVTGSVTMVHDQWVSVRLDLTKMVSNYTTEMAAIRIGYDYGRNLYIRNITFQPTTVVESKVVGFVMPQNEIPDYGSATSGELEIPVNAVYTSSSGTSYRIGTNGQFTLSDGESVTFQDQFRRGSYMYLSEETSYLYDTSWSMFEGRNETPVTSSTVPTNPASTTVTGGGQSMTEVSGSTVTDGRIEKIGLLTGEEEDENEYQKSASAASPGNTFVFRHYSDPDNTSEATKLKIVYTNTIKTGSLTFGKALAQGSAEFDSNEEFTFYVEFYNLGGMNLEDSPIIAGPYSLKVGDTKEITGIPLGTWFIIHEVKSEDDSFVLENATYNLGAYGTGTMIPSDNTVKGQATYSVEGLIPTTGKSSVSYTFYNSKKSVVSLTVNKVWDTSASTGTVTVPNYINVQLQRKAGDNVTWTEVSGYENVTLQRDYTSWDDYSYTFKDLDRYTDNTEKVLYSYRIMELQEVRDPDGNVTYTVIESDDETTGVLELTDGTKYEVTYGTVENAKDEDGKVIDDEFTQTITNKLKPKAKVTVTKAWNVPEDVTKPDVTVQLQRRTGTDAFAKIDDSHNATLNEDNDWTYTFDDLEEKDSDGKKYDYRVVELNGNTAMDKDGDTFTVTTVEGENAVTVEYRVTYGEVANAKDGEGKAIANEYTQTITNSAVPEVTLQITKLDATDTNKKLDGVEFKLEKDGDSNFVKNVTTNADGIANFAGLKAGTYTLTETKAKSGYSLLKSSIKIEITENTDKDTGAITYTAKVDSNDAESFKLSGNTYTLGMTVYNKQGLTMPSTGGTHGFEYWILGGLCITAIPLLLYTLLGFKKGGKYSRK